MLLKVPLLPLLPLQSSIFFIVRAVDLEKLQKSFIMHFIS